jgi:hypothetical protein
VLTLVSGRQQRELATVTRLGQGLLMVRAAFSGSTATVKTPNEAVDLGDALGLLKGAQGAMICHGNEEGQKIGFDLAGANLSSSGPYLKGFLYQLVADVELF